MSEGAGAVNCYGVPMEEKHHINCIAICTNRGNQRKCVKFQKEARAAFYIDEDEKVLTVYSYCNLHGLWKLHLCDRDTCDCSCYSMKH